MEINSDIYWFYLMFLYVLKANIVSSLQIFRYSIDLYIPIEFLHIYSLMMILSLIFKWEYIFVIKSV